MEELQAQVRTQADADDQVMTYVNTEVEKWKVRLLSFSADVFPTFGYYFSEARLLIYIHV